jgi:hypothetical protein
MLLEWGIVDLLKGWNTVEMRIMWSIVGFTLK